MASIYLDNTLSVKIPNSFRCSAPGDPTAEPHTAQVVDKRWELSSCQIHHQAYHFGAFLTHQEVAKVVLFADPWAVAADQEQAEYNKAYLICGRI